MIKFKITYSDGSSDEIRQTMAAELFGTMEWSDIIAVVDLGVGEVHTDIEGEKWERLQ